MAPSRLLSIVVVCTTSLVIFDNIIRVIRVIRGSCLRRFFIRVIRVIRGLFLRLFVVLFRFVVRGRPVRPKTSNRSNWQWIGPLFKRNFLRAADRTISPLRRCR